MNILCTICARKGSKGLKNKNLIKINNKHLIFYSIDQAKKVNEITDIVISTDLDIPQKELKKRKLKIFFKRKANLSSTRAGKVPVIRDALIKAEKYYQKKYDVIIDLDVTSPLREVIDIKSSIKKFLKNKSNNLISVCKSRRNPYFNMVEIKKNIPFLSKKFKKNILRRQDAPKVYDMNASIYIWKKKYLMSTNKIFSKKTAFYEMPYNRSIDIDSLHDLESVKYFMKWNSRSIDVDSFHEIKPTKYFIRKNDKK